MEGFGTREKMEPTDEPEVESRGKKIKGAERAVFEMFGLDMSARGKIIDRIERNPHFTDLSERNF